MWKGLGWVVRINPGYLKGALCCGPGPQGCGLGSEFEEECRGRGLQTLSLSNLGERAQPSLQPRVLGIPQPWVWRGLGRNWGDLFPCPLRSVVGGLWELFRLTVWLPEWGGLGE